MTDYSIARCIDKLCREQGLSPEEAHAEAFRLLIAQIETEEDDEEVECGYDRPIGHIPDSF
ncbi:MAG: hypothetical protein NC342_09375 [Pseudoflavonifractor sp.]|nr:hypothetical protein [Alloprevotella sp.]MCM1117730.1 hypothetical protein [Pseudoflavonifractor sp.]